MGAINRCNREITYRPTNTYTSTNTNQYTTHTQTTSTNQALVDNTNKTLTHNTHSPAIKAHSLGSIEVRYSDLTLQRLYPHTYSHRTKAISPQKHNMSRYTQPQTIKAHGKGTGTYKNYSKIHTHTHT